jgi:hypothetical protein
MPDINLEGIAGLAIKPPSEQQWSALAARQKREMGGTVDQVFSAQNMGEAVRRLHQKRHEEQRRLKRMLWGVANIINLMPFPLNVNGVLHARLAGPDGNQVPACPVGKPYEHTVIQDEQWSIRDEGAGMDNVDNYTPIAFVPMELAEDYAHEFLNRMGVGGVIIYEGTDKPEEKPGLQQSLEDARRARNKWLLRKVHEAEADWADTSGRGRKNITELHRKAAEVLLYEKILKHQPAWLLALNAEDGEIPDPCPGCGEVADRKASVCKGCRYVYKPIEAYKAALIEYGHVSMERLTADEWQEVNEIKANRDKARQAGESKASGHGHRRLTQ